MPDRKLLYPGLFALVALGGFILVIQGPAFPEIKSGFNLSIKAGSLFPLTYFLGCFLGYVTVAFISGRVNPKLILSLSALGDSISLLAFSMVPGCALALALFMFVGFFNASVIFYPGLICSRIEGEAKDRMLSILYAFFAVGVVAGPVIAGAVIGGGLGWRTLYRISAAPFAILFLYTLVAPLKLKASLMKAAGIRHLKALFGKEASLFIPLAVATVLYVGSESVMIVWTVPYLTERYKPLESILRASSIVTLFWLGMVIGRFIVASIVGRAGRFRILVFLSGASVLSVLTGSSFSVKLLSESGIAASGLFFSGIYPLLIASVDTLEDENRDLAFSLLFAFGGLGGAIIPYIIGVFSDSFGFTWGMRASAIPLVLLAITTYIVKSKTGSK